MTQESITVELGERSYPILIGPGLLQDSKVFADRLDDDRIVIVTNDRVGPLYLELLKAALGDRVSLTVVLPDGEAYKNLDAVSHLYDRLLEARCDRKTVLVALGGGVIGDVVGFVAATYMRGIRFVQIPTTLLAQVDSSVGGKTGVNHPRGKNMIGAFHQPVLVVADTDTLTSLPEREIKAGLAEVIKYGLINLPEFFVWLQNSSSALLELESGSVVQAVKQCCQAKADIVALDETEAGKRALLNLGHTFGHAIETAAGYGTWLHGETVAMGMVMAADLSARLEMLESQVATEIRKTLEENFGMPVLPPADITVERYLELMASDKKAEAGNIRFILLEAIGEAVIRGNIDPAILRQTLTAGDSLCH